MSYELQPGEQDIGSIELNGTPITVVKMVDQLPNNPARAETCRAHIAEGITDVLGSFMVEGCDFEVGLREGAVRVGVSCVGPSVVRHHCRLVFRQEDSAGTIVQKGTVGE